MKKKKILCATSLIKKNVFFHIFANHTYKISKPASFVRLFVRLFDIFATFCANPYEWDRTTTPFFAKNDKKN